MAKTVGELRKFLESYQDDLLVAYMDDDGYYHDSIDVVGIRILGIFHNPATKKHQLPPYYREYKLNDNEIHIKDVEVLVLG